MPFVGGPESEIDLLAAANVYGLSVARRKMRDGDEALEYCRNIWEAARAGDASDLLQFIARENKKYAFCAAWGVVVCDVSDMFYIAKFVDIPRSRVCLTMKGLIRLDADRRGLLHSWDNFINTPPEDRSKITSLIMSMYGPDVLLDDARNPIAKVMRADGKNVEAMFRMDDAEFENLICGFDPICMYPAFIAMSEDGIDFWVHALQDDF